MEDFGSFDNLRPGDENEQHECDPFDVRGLPSAHAATLQVSLHDGSAVDECGDESTEHNQKYSHGREDETATANVVKNRNEET